MKHTVKTIIILILLIAVTGCSADGDMANRVGNSNNVDKVINQQIDKAESGKNSAEKKETYIESKNVSEEQENTSKRIEDDSADIDYDLTSMSSDMVYATVYQMMVDPKTYTGKTFRMEGIYYAVYYEPTAKYYHYCIIQDAQACCAQGMEFIWGDGSHAYPKDYPEENAKIVVQGTFETYREDGDDKLYCRLKGATMEVINE